jgi:hypothetical protein
MTVSVHLTATANVAIAGLGFAVDGPAPAWDRPGQTFRPHGVAPAVRLHTAVVSPPPDPLGPVLFDPGSFWTARAHPRGFAIAIESPAGSGRLARLAVMDPTWSAGDITVHPDLPIPGRPTPALAWPLDTLLTTSFLAHRDGLLFHGAGLVVNGAGYLFCGPSGAGKSTVVKLLEQRHGVTVLNDERCIARREDGAWRLYGTPWHGEVDRVAYGGVPLRKVFLLAQAAEHRAVPLALGDAARRLFGRCLWPFWDRAGMEAGLSTLEALCREVPAYTLQFRRDAGVLGCIIE